MLSTAFLLIFTGFYLQYNLSRKVKARHKPSWLGYMARNARLTRIAGVGTTMLAMGIMIAQLGIGSGLFGFVVVLMCSASLIVVLSPFRYLRWAHVVCLYLGAIFFEVLLF